MTKNMENRDIMVKSPEKRPLAPKLQSVRSTKKTENALVPVEVERVVVPKRKVKPKIQEAPSKLQKQDKAEVATKAAKVKRGLYDYGYNNAPKPTGNLIDYFPEGFTPRPQQLYILSELDKLIKAGVKFVIVDAPTGIGKSLLAMAVAGYFGNCYICTAQKSLQDQYLRDFSHMAVTVKGRNAFPCLEYDQRRDGMINDCDHGWCKNQKKKNKGEEDVKDKCPRNTGGDKEENFAYFSASRGEVYYVDTAVKPCLYQEQKGRALSSPIVITNYDYLLFRRTQNHRIR